MERQKFLLIIEADTNDGDYTSRTKEWEEGDKDAIDINTLEKVAKAIDEKNGAWGRGEMLDKNNDPSIIYKDVLTKKEIDWFDDLVPYGEYGIHTIEEITLYKIEDKQSLY